MIKFFKFVIILSGVALFSCTKEVHKETITKETKVQKYNGEGFLVQGFLPFDAHPVILKSVNDSVLYKSITNEEGYFNITGNQQDTIPVYIDYNGFKIHFLLYNTSIIINKDLVIKTKFQEDYQQYIGNLDNVSRLSDNYMQQIKTAIIANDDVVKFRNTLAKQQYKEISYLKDYITNNPNKYSALLALQKLEEKADISIETYDKLISNITIKNSKLATNLNNYFAAKEIRLKKELITNTAKKTNTVTPVKPRKIIVEDRAKAYYFKGETLNGTITNLPTIVGNSKLIYIDFWASWCGPCRIQNPVLRQLYKKYHSQGLEIVSISVDTDENAWRNAINMDNLPWINIIDRNKTISSRYYVEKLPFGVLIDDKGMVIQDFVSAGKLKQLIPRYINEK